MVYILIAILVFGFLILIHEFGHYITARLCGVQVHEFAIGMGPKLVWYTSKKTGIVYSLRMLPIGGFVSMLGENPDEDDARPRPADEPSFDPSRSLANKPAWQRFIVNAAGATMNLLFGFLVMAILAATTAKGGTVIGNIHPASESGAAVSSQEQGLMVGDEVIAVNGKRVHIAEQLYYRIMHDGEEPVELKVKRGDETHTLVISFATTEESGITIGQADFQVREEKGIRAVAKHALYKSVYAVGMIWESMFDLVTGKYSMDAMSGPVGVAGAISDAAKEGLYSLAVMSVVISINLGIFNLLPFPALDGGHLLFIVIEMITGKKVPAKVGAIFDTVGLLLLFALMIFVTFQDITKLFT